MLFELRAAFYESRVLFLLPPLSSQTNLADGSLGLKIRNAAEYVCCKSAVFETLLEVPQVKKVTHRDGDGSGKISRCGSSGIASLRAIGAAMPL